MRSKKEILDSCYCSYDKLTGKARNRYDYEQRALLLELLADIRDEQVSLNKTLSAVLAGLLVPAQQGGKE